MDGVTNIEAIALLNWVKDNGWLVTVKRTGCVWHFTSSRQGEHYSVSCEDVVIGARELARACGAPGCSKGPTLETERPAAAPTRSVPPGMA